MEVWETIEGYDSYEVSNKGNIHNKKRKSTNLKPSNRGEYKAISLYNPKTKEDDKKSIHKLVAKAFVDNPDNKPYVNHKDGNKHNNKADNLVWATARENTNHAIQTGLIKTHRQRVGKYESNGSEEPLAIYNSIKEAAEANNCDRSGISKVCNGKADTCGGYFWKHENQQTEKFDDFPEGEEIENFPNYIITKEGRVFGKHKMKYLAISYHNSPSITLHNDNTKKTICISTLLKTYFPNIKLTNKEIKENNNDDSEEKITNKIKELTKELEQLTKQLETIKLKKQQNEQQNE